MLRKVFAICVVILGTAQSAHAFVGHGSRYLFSQVARTIDLTLGCLETTPNLSTNSSFIIGFAIKELTEVLYSVPNLGSYKKNVVQNFIKRYDAFVDNALKNYPDDLATQTVLDPHYWSRGGAYPFKTGRIQKMPPVNQSLWEIYEESARTVETGNCIGGLIAANLLSPVDRQCASPCDYLFSTDNLESPPPLDERVYYVGVSLLLNCTNHGTDFPEIINPICGQIKRQIDSMYLQRDQKEIQSIMYIFLNKIKNCAVFGIPDVLTSDLITYVVSLINCNGCVTFDGYTAEDGQVMTSMVSAVMCQVLRLIEEERNGLPSFYGRNLLSQLVDRT